MALSTSKILSYFGENSSFLNFFIGVYLNYNVVLISGVQQSDSDTDIDIFFSIMVYHRI